VTERRKTAAKRLALIFEAIASGFDRPMAIAHWVGVRGIKVSVSTVKRVLKSF
jgi:hypothetical protein